MPDPNWQPNAIDDTLINLALEEDLSFPYFDVTSELLFRGFAFDKRVAIISKQATPVVVCGIPVVRALLVRVDPTVEMQIHCQEGALLQPGATLLTLHGPGKILLMLERVILNFLRHLSAIATLTALFVTKVKGTSTQILDTRKTTPGFRHLEKYAVTCGGGVNHRQGLFDAIMIKDTHVDLLGGMSQALARLPLIQENPLPVIVEVRTTAELEVVLSEGRQKVQRVLLDNMSCAVLKECVQTCQGIFSTEASGNITLETILKIAQTGVDFASVGMLTHSAGQVDLSMQGL